MQGTQKENDMKIAVITVTYNDGYKFEQWKELYKQYADSIDYHIIVDNGSNKKYIEAVRQDFQNSIVLERETNGGSTGAYNTGIKYVLDQTDADVIMLLGNDIKLNSESIHKLTEYLDSNDSVGMVAPLLCNADSDIIADFGCMISEDLTLNPYMCGRNIAEVREREHICDTVTGGANMARRDFYLKVGLQDENLFMYSDEVDMGLRAKACGYKIACISDAVCWHQHINPDGGEYRKPYSAFLMARNKIYLANKHHLYKSRRKVRDVYIVQSIKSYIKGVVCRRKALRERGVYIFKGVLYGLKNDMSSNQYTQY